MDYYPTTSSVPSKAGESTRTPQDVRISSLGKRTTGTKARITLVKIQQAEAIKGSNSQSKNLTSHRYSLKKLNEKRGTMPANIAVSQDRVKLNSSALSDQMSLEEGLAPL